MTLRYLLDTTAVSAPISTVPDRQTIKKLMQYGHECAIAAPVWHELLYGAARLPEGKRKTAVEAYLRDVVEPSFEILPYGEIAGGWHAQERARLEGLGKPAPFVDGQIAAIACVNELILVTTNVKDFAGYKDLIIEDWSKPRRS